jgi:AcrR family transcriptional regulator
LKHVFEPAGPTGSLCAIERAVDIPAGTRERLLDATEALLAERAEHELTVRDITARAGANVAAIGYHFGSRDELVAAAMRRVIGRLTEERRAELRALPEDADLEAVVCAWLAPALAALRDGGAGEGGDWRVLARSFAAAGPVLVSLAAELRPEVEVTLVGRLARLLPHLGAEELAWRQAATLGLAGFLGSSGGPLLAARGGEQAAEHFVAYVVGALRAPAAGG